MRFFFRSVFHIVYNCFAFCFLLAGVLAVVVYFFSTNLPDYKTLQNPKIPFASRAYSSTYQLFEEFKGDEYRLYVPFDSIPKYTIQSFVAAEDKTFYTNRGIDIFGIARSVFYNITQDRGLSGGSTITQQVVKNYLLSPEKSMTRKIKEAILAIKASSYFSKEKIMELYLNKIYFGHGAYGIESASLIYFGKSSSSLSLEESALLATIPPAPTKFDPFYNKDMKKRRDLLLHKMLDGKFISATEYKNAVSVPVLLYSGPVLNKKLNAEFFADEVKKQISKDLGVNDIENKGYFIKTTLSSYYQKLADEALVEGLRRYENTQRSKKVLGHFKLEKIKNDWLSILSKAEDPSDIRELELIIILEKHEGFYTVGRKNNTKSTLPRNASYSFKVGDLTTAHCTVSQCLIQTIPTVNGGIVVMEASTGNVLALSGGYDYKKSQFNVATQAFRQPGSSFKPFLYLSALENHMSPRTLINDDEVEISQGRGMLPWRPRNYKNIFFGTLTLRRALEVSQNTASVQIGRYVGMKNISEIAKRFGVYESDSLAYSTLLGAKEVTLLKIITAYATIANNGIKVSPNFITSIRDKDNNMVLNRSNYSCPECESTQNINIYSRYNPQPPENTTIMEKIATDEDIFQISDVMRGSVIRGTSRGVSSVKNGISAKTGTTNAGIDYWFIGFWNNIVIGVYVGSDIPRSLGENLSGARVALPIFKKFLENLPDDNDFYIKMQKNIEYSYVDLSTGMPVNSDTPNKNIILESSKNSRLTPDVDSYKVQRFALHLKDIYDRKHRRRILQNNDDDFIMRDLPLDNTFDNTFDNALGDMSDDNQGDTFFQATTHKN